MSVFNKQNFRRELTAPLYQQLYEHLRAAILAGQLPRGTKIPSTRALADELGVSRNTILNAYEQLFAEGYLESVEGSGTFVTRELPELFQPAQPPAVTASTKPQVHRLSDRVQQVMNAPSLSRGRDGRISHAFRAGQPALDAFPFEIWAKLMARHAHRMHPGLLMYQETAGYRPLREAVANHVIVARQVRCTPDQVIIVNGSQGGLNLAAQVLINPGDHVWVEDPGYPGAAAALLAAGARILPVPVDEDGLLVEALPHLGETRLGYLTPAHQFPLGVTLSLSRRLALLEWARAADAHLLEDDYDSEYRFAGRPLASLQGLDRDERVIYVGTFSKVMFPALRLGYVIVPTTLVDAFLAMRRAADTHPTILEQAALTDFISEGHFTRHIRRMRVLYAERRAALLQAARDLPLDIFAPEVGMHLIGWLPDGVDDQLAARRAADYDVEVMALSRLTIGAPIRPGLALGYAAINKADIRDGVRRLAAALKEIV